MQSKISKYESDDIDVSYDVKRCIHAEECVKRLRVVFDPNKRPWIQPQHAPADELAETIHHCPTGALHYTRKDTNQQEAIPQENTIRIVPNGPLYVRGDATIITSEGETLLQDTRIALCRCGASKNKPLCDNSHKDIQFTDDGLPQPADDLMQITPDEAGTPLTITANTNGSLKIEGQFTMQNANGEVIFAGAETWLCRCGGSSNKPFCDGTHKKIDFKSE